MFRLALALGKTVGELSEELPDSELLEWMIFYRLEPFGDERADLRAGIVASTVANANRGKRGRSLKPTDFMPFLKVDDQRQKMRPRPKKLSQQARAILGPLAKKKDG